MPACDTIWIMNSTLDDDVDADENIIYILCGEQGKKENITISKKKKKIDMFLGAL